MMLMEAFQMSAQDAIDHLMSPPAAREPILVATKEVCETKMGQAARRAARYQGVDSISRFKIGIKPVEANPVEPS